VTEATTRTLPGAESFGVALPEAPRRRGAIACPRPAPSSRRAAPRKRLRKPAGEGHIDVEPARASVYLDRVLRPAVHPLARRRNAGSTRDADEAGSCWAPGGDRGCVLAAARTGYRDPGGPVSAATTLRWLSRAAVLFRHRDRGRPRPAIAPGELPSKNRSVSANHPGPPREDPCAMVP